MVFKFSTQFSKLNQFTYCIKQIKGSRNALIHFGKKNVYKEF